MDPFRITGAGAYAAMHVLRFNFGNDLSAAPKLKAWDDYTMLTTTHRIFAGTTVNGSKPMIGAIGCITAPSASWWPTSLVVAAEVGVASLLKGDSGFVLLSDGALGYESGESSEESSGEGGGDVYANIDFSLPSDADPEDTFSAVLTLEYEYTGIEPDVIIYGNKGTEGVPVWEELTAVAKDTEPQVGMTEIKPVSAGEGPTGTGTYFFARPVSGEVHAGEIWCRDYA